MYPFFPESPRWLVDTGRLDKAENIIAKMRKYNGDEKINDLSEVLNKLSENQKTENAKMSIIDIFKYRYVEKYMIECYY